MAGDELPVVDAVGVVRQRHDPDGADLGAVLVTRFLDWSLPYRYLFSHDPSPELRPQLVDAGALLMARLHLVGVFWGDCSLSNVLFRRDAGALMAYLADAETVERHPSPLVTGSAPFDVEELSVEATDGGNRLRIRPVVVEEGHHLP